MDNLCIHYEDMFGGYPSCYNCYEMHCTGQCLRWHPCFNTPKLMIFREYLKCRKRAIDENHEGYMLFVGDFIPDNWDEDFKLVGDGPPLFHEKVIAKYFEKLVKLDEGDMLLGDCTYWEEFRYWGYNPLERVVRTDFSLPMDLDCGPIIPPDGSSSIEEEQKTSENLITVELSEDEAINKEEINSYFFDFIDCPKIDFVIKPDEEIQIYIVEVESDGIDKSYYVENGKEDVWRSNEKWTKAKRRKMDKTSKAFFRCP